MEADTTQQSFIITLVANNPERVIKTGIKSPRINGLSAIICCSHNITSKQTNMICADVLIDPEIDSTLSFLSN